MHPRPIHHNQLPHGTKNPTPTLTRTGRRRPTHPHRSSTSHQRLMILTQHASATLSPRRLSIRSIRSARLTSSSHTRPLLRLKLNSARHTLISTRSHRIDPSALPLTPFPVTHEQRIRRT